MMSGAACFAGFRFLANGCSWYETNHLGGCLRLSSPRPQCSAAADTNTQRHLRQAEGRSTPEHTLAVLMPYRGAGRVGDLHSLCSRLPAHLEAIGVQYRLFLLNQVDALPFNRGALVNAAVRLMGETDGLVLQRSGMPPPVFDYLAIHDIDRFPVRNGRGGRVACDNATAEYYSFPHPSPRVLHPSSFAGGVLVLQRAHFEAVNGFSNEYWGWGEEDNDLFLRLRWCGWAPRHGQQLESCMEHRDCRLCARQKRAVDPRRLQLHRERVGAQLARPSRHMDAAFDGLHTANFTALRRTTRRCGVGESVHVIDVALERADEIV